MDRAAPSRAVTQFRSSCLDERSGPLPLRHSRHPRSYSVSAWHRTECHPLRQIGQPEIHVCRTGAWFDIRTRISASRARNISQLLIIRLFQHAPIGSVEGCPDRRSRRRSGSFNPSSPPKRHASNTWPLVGGRRALSALNAGTGERTNCLHSDVGNVPSVVIRSR